MDGGCTLYLPKLWDYCTGLGDLDGGGGRLPVSGPA